MRKIRVRCGRWIAGDRHCTVNGQYVFMSLRRFFGRYRVCAESTKGEKCSFHDTAAAAQRAGAGLARKVV